MKFREIKHLIQLLLAVQAVVGCKPRSFNDSVSLSESKVSNGETRSKLHAQYENLDKALEGNVQTKQNPKVLLVLESSKLDPLWEDHILVLAEKFEKAGVKTQKLKLQTNASGSDTLIDFESKIPLTGEQKLLLKAELPLLLLLSDFASQDWRSHSRMATLKEWGTWSTLTFGKLLPDWLLRSTVFTSWIDGFSATSNSVPAAGLLNAQIVAKKTDFSWNEDEPEVSPLVVPYFDFTKVERFDTITYLKINFTPLLNKKGKLRNASCAVLETEKNAVIKLRESFEEAFGGTRKTSPELSDEANRVGIFAVVSTVFARKLAGSLVDQKTFTVSDLRKLLAKLEPKGSDTHIAEILLGGVVKPVENALGTFTFLNDEYRKAVQLDSRISKEWAKDAPIILEQK